MPIHLGVCIDNNLRHKLLKCCNRNKRHHNFLLAGPNLGEIRKNYALIVNSTNCGKKT